MKSIRIQNLRSLEDTGVIELKPINVLVGENSSGKSTFLRTFPLLRQSEEVKKTGPILWFGKYVDFGSYKDSINVNSQDKTITFDFDFGRIRLNQIFYYRLSKISKKGTELSLRVRIVGDDKFDSITRYCEIHIADNIVILEFSSTGHITRFDVNESSFLQQSRNISVGIGRGIVPSLLLFENSKKGDELGIRYKRAEFGWLFEKDDIDIEGVKISKSIYEKINEVPIIGSSEEMLESLKSIEISDSSPEFSYIQEWTTSDYAFIKLRDTLLASSISSLCSLCNELLSDFAERIHYIAPLRATAERYYRYQNLAVDEVDFQGLNLAMFLKNLSEPERKSFSLWTLKLFDFYPQIITSPTHVSLAIKQGESLINIADAGFGISQVLPIITQLWQLTQSRFFRRYLSPYESSTYLAIEQPELHLHPRMQGKLSEAFVDVVNQSKKKGDDLKLIIETHSDAIINTFGHLITKGVLDPDDINVILFERPSFDKASIISTSKYNEKGFLQNWPYGFFEPDWG